MNAGRWQTHRERCQIADPNPAPPAGGDAAFGEMIAGALRRLGLDRDLWLKDLEGEWSGIVGHPVSRHARPGSFDRGVLSIFVDSSPWLSELNSFGKDRIIARLKERFGPDRVRSVVLKLDPDVPGHNNRK